jgi:hypothetical protein
MEGEEDYKLVINTSFILDNDVELTIKNINIDTLNKLNKDGIIDLIMFKWYMYGNFDLIDINNEQYVIVSKTKKKIELVRYNTKRVTSE